VQAPEASAKVRRRRRSRPADRANCQRNLRGPSVHASAAAYQLPCPDSARCAQRPASCRPVFSLVQPHRLNTMSRALFMTCLQVRGKVLAEEPLTRMSPAQTRLVAPEGPAGIPWPCQSASRGHRPRLALGCASGAQIYISSAILIRTCSLIIGLSCGSPHGVNRDSDSALMAGMAHVRASRRRRVNGERPPAGRSWMPAERGKIPRAAAGRP
jgi:hypothetical protein